MDTFTVHASKNGDWVETQFTSPTMTVAKANRPNEVWTLFDGVEQPAVLHYLPPARQRA